MVIVIPVCIILAVVVVNAVAFVSECAAFDRQARQLICTYGASPGYGQSSGSAAAMVEGELASQFSQSFEHVSVSASGAPPGLVHYTATIEFTPTLFGRSFSGSVFGVHIPSLRHSTKLALDPYKPGAVL